jgi:hypothetical protein
MTTCIQKLNKGAGFIPEHGRFCIGNGKPCDEDVTHHVNLGAGKDKPHGYWCANVCKKHGEYYANKRRDSLVLEGAYIEEV